MRVADRAPRQILLAPFTPRHWRALAGILRTFDRPAEALGRYVLNRGRYPWLVNLATPLGTQSVMLDNRHDLLTVCEIFCRRDYGSDSPRLVLDIGANVGLAALFFLTRRTDSIVVCCEPDPANVEGLRRNLAGFEARYEVIEAAVVAGDEDTVRFRPAGRYGRIDEAGDLEVAAVPIARLVARVAAARGRIDLLKIDTEGTEQALVDALPAASRPRSVRWEDGAGHVRQLTFDRT